MSVLVDTSVWMDRFHCADATLGARGRGLSWSDVQLLAAVRIDGLTLWTRDRSLRDAAAELGIAAAV